MKEIEDNEAFRVAIRSRAYHAALLEASRKCGGIKRMAVELGVDPSRLSNWILLKSFPSMVTRCSDGRTRRNKRMIREWPELSRRFFILTGKTMKELFPEFVRLSGFLAMPKKAETVREIPASHMLGLCKKPALLEGPEVKADLSILRERLAESLATLTHRQRTVLELRFGLGSGYPMTLDEVAERLDVTRERIRQIEGTALRKLQHPYRRKSIESVAASILNLNPCPQCKKMVGAFHSCPECKKFFCMQCANRCQHPCIAPRPIR